MPVNTSGRRWRRELGIFPLLGLLYFALGSALLSAGPPIKFWGRFQFLTLFWATLWLIWRWRYWQERRALKSTTVGVDPDSVYPGGTVTCHMRINPPRKIRLWGWSTTLGCAKTWEGEFELEGEDLFQRSIPCPVHSALFPGEAAEFACSLAIPADAFPPRKSGSDEVAWWVRICVKFVGSPEWSLKEPLKVNVLPSDQVGESAE
jgi:hypothetical protein